MSQQARSNRVSQAELERMHEAHRILYGGLWVRVDRAAGRAEMNFPNDSDAGITRQTGPDGKDEFVIKVTFETELPIASNELQTAISNRTAPSLDEAIDLVKAYMLQRKWITEEEFEFNHRSLIDGHYWSRAREWARFSADGRR